MLVDSETNINSSAMCGEKVSENGIELILMDGPKWQQWIIFWGWGSI